MELSFDSAIALLGLYPKNPETLIQKNLCDSMDGTGEHYAKWNKPGGEGQISYDLTFNGNVMNKRKKQTKYN